MGERGDVGRANGIVARGERGGTQVASRVDRQQVPPLEVRLGCATLVTLKFILNQYLRFVRIVSITPPCKAQGNPLGAHHYAVLRGAVSAQDDGTIALFHAAVANSKLYTLNSTL